MCKRVTGTLLATLFCATKAWSAQPLTLTYQNTDLAAPLTQQSLWRPSDVILMHCRNQAVEPYTSCMLDEMKKQKLPKVALRFSELTSAYITNYHKTGPLTIVKTFIPAADHTIEFFIKNTTGKLINVNAGDAQKLLESQPHLRQKFKLPQNLLVAQFVTESVPAVIQSSGMWKTEFSFQLREQCMACKVLGKITIAYRFNKSGEFKDLEIVSVRLKKAAQKDFLK